MVTRVRTIDFLPEIFKTKTNSQFLEATLDQLTQQPNFKRIQGYIGSKFGYGINSSDKYLEEPTKSRTDYQLEPSVVFKKTDTNIAKDVLTYQGFIDSLKLQGNVVENNNVLFENQFYAWDSFVDLDKVINYSQYYWLPFGPEAINITNTEIYKNLTYTVTSQPNVYSFDTNEYNIDQLNPIIILVRGGTYTFAVDQASQFYIQTSPGLNGVETARPNISSREVYGVINNGETKGAVTFNVPLSDAQNEWNFPGNVNIDIATTLKFNDIQGKRVVDIANIDGVTNYQNKTLLFYGNLPGTKGALSQFFGNEFDDVSYESTTYTDINKHYYKLNFVGNSTDGYVINLTEVGLIPDNTKITINYGTQYISRNFVKNSNSEIFLIPPLTAPLDTLYYQDSTNSEKFGTIKIVDNSGSTDLDINDILGQKQYTSPNNIKFTNGLKVEFAGNIYPEQYAQGQYYVEGVGTSIQLLPVNDFVIPEEFGQSATTPFDYNPYDSTNYGDTLFYPEFPDYITIARNSINKNAWSRSNRWFHIDVLNMTLQYALTSTDTYNALNDPDKRAKRPILEFYPNLKLFNSGSIAKPNVDFINFDITDAFTQVAGQTSFYPDGLDSVLYEGATIIFAGDTDINIRNKIYVANMISVTGTSTPVISLSLAPNGHAAYGDQTATLLGSTYKGKTFWFDGTAWIQGQLKERINQPPKFDVFDSNNISYGDKDFYPSNDFDGCTLLEYTIGTGTDDPILKFPISYSSLNNLGDINFTVSLNTQTFNYVDNSLSITANVNNGYVFNYIDRETYTRAIGWQTAIGESFQYQVFNTSYNGIPTTPTFVVDIAAKEQSSTSWPVITVYVNNVRLSASEFTFTTTNTTTTVILSSTPVIGTTVDILIYSDQVSKTGYYQIPSNLDHNPFNTEITSINLGDIRGHYKSICNNNSNFAGIAFGSNNYRDLGNVVPYGMRIIQNSASLVNTGAFLRNNVANFFDALNFSGTEYVKFKALMIQTMQNNEYTSTDTSAYILDSVLEKISDVRINSNPFFWSDMLPNKNAEIINSYVFKSNISTSNFNLSRVYDFTKANYYGVLVYLTRRINGRIRNIQLIKDVDYTISTTEKQLVVTKDLVNNDVITVKEYNQTYGSYIPNTPTKLGLYPSSLPEVIYDTSYLKPTYFIKGHDGSYNKLYGDYVDGFLTDYRDSVLLEFETRIYNNLKISSEIPLIGDDIIPGYFRDNGISYAEFEVIYLSQFLNWVGLNRIDYQDHQYDPTNPFTFNYKGATLKIDKTKIFAGNWRGLYNYLYDTTTPDKTPWEMLGLTSKPDWWDTRYGATPYTSDNTYMWGEISQGFVYNNGDSYINTKRIREGLLSIIPVNSDGQLRNPFEFLISAYNVDIFSNAWQVGDVGPAEYSYLKSSSWPFDLMRMFALLKPAKFFALGIDVDNYKFNTEFNQYLYENRFRESISDLTIYGNGTSKNSYINWLVDYLCQYGIDGHTDITELLKNLDVRLTYRLAGFSDKNLLNFFVEKGTPNSSNNSLLIPDDSYSILLYDNQPNDTIVYSSVIVQKLSNGYKIFGNSQTKTYFTSLTPIEDGLFDIITVNDITVKLPKNYRDTKILVPYGNLFYNYQDLFVFMRGYGKYLESQGMIFGDIENGLEINWDQMIAETLYWIETGWDVGSIINVNPSARTINVDKENNVIQPLTLAKENFILNQNSSPILLSDLNIFRQGTTFNVKALNEGDSMSYFNANLSTIEQVVIFDNETVFNDVLYNLQTGLRQQRIYVKGSKSAGWSGYIDAGGFILNQDNIEEWTENRKYSKGTIVKFKNEYYSAKEIIVLPKTKFDYNDWTKTSYDMIQKGLLPNPSTRSAEATLFYDTVNPNLSSDGDLLSFSLIGYRPRQYFASANFDDATQVNLYKNMISVKGTVDSVTRLQGINVQQNTLNYDIHENWAIKSSEFGGVLNQNFVDFTLDESLLTGDPSIVSIIKNTSVNGSQQQIPLYKIKNYNRPLSNSEILPTLSYDYQEKLPSAGYVNIDDVIQYGFTVSDLSDTLIYDLYKTDYLWIADKDNTWQVYTPVSYGAIVINVINNLNGTITVTFDKPHNLLKNQVFGILNFDPSVDGYHLIDSIINLNSLIVSSTLDQNTISINGTGLSFLLQSQRVVTARDIPGLPLLNAEYDTNRVWVDENEVGDWTVYEKTNNYEYEELSKFGLITDNFGSSVAYVEGVGYFIGDPGNGTVYHYSKTSTGLFYLRNTITYPGTEFGTTIITSQDLVIISDPDETISNIYVYKIPPSGEINSIILQEILSISGARVGDSMDISGDSNWLYLGAKTDNAVVPFQRSKILTYQGAGLTLSQTTTINTNYFVCSGNVLTSLKEGQIVNFLPSYTSLGISLAEDTIELTTYFEVDGDQRGLLTNGDKVAFYNTGALGTYLYTIASESYDPGSDVTTFYTVEEFEAFVIIPAGTNVYKVTFSDDLTYTVVTGTYNSTTNKTTFFTLEKIEYTATSGSYIYIGAVNYILTGIVIYSDLSNVGAEYGASLATNYDGSKLYIGSPKEDYSVSVLDTGVVYVYDRLVQNIEVQYDQSPYQFLILITPFNLTPQTRISLNGVILPPNNYVVILNAIIIGTIGIKAGDIITVNSTLFVNTYRLTNMDNPSDLRPGEQFGFALDCNKYGSELIVGCPYDVSNNSAKEGSAIRYTDEGKRYGTLTGVIGCNLIEGTYILLNGNIVALRHDTPSLATITAGVSNTVTVSSTLAAILPSYGYITLQNTSTGSTEQLYYTSVTVSTGVLNCTSTATASYTVGQTNVILPLGSAINVANKINQAYVTNIFAYATTDGRLIIRLRDQNLGQLNNKLNISVFNGNFLYQMGFFFPKSQVIQDPHQQTRTQFGYAIRFNEENSFVVSAPVNTRYVSTKFDFSSDENNHNDTVFDNNFTTFEDGYNNAGSVYMYDYIESYNESLTDIGNYIYAQSCNENTLDYGVQPYYGKAISFNNNVVVIGVPDFNTSAIPGGTVAVYNNSTSESNWHVYRESDAIVDVNKIQKVQLYNNTDDTNLVSLDYIDPLQGKLLGIVRENIDFISTTDPAGYNGPGVNKGSTAWAKSFVGKLWFNTSTTKFLNYHQNDVVYNSKYFGVVFPGSDVTVYSWVESNVIPAFYEGTGTPYDLGKYSVVQETDSNNNLVPKYFYWVRNTNTINTKQKKTLSDTIVEQYITDPRSSGIAYMTALRPNTFGLYNSQEYINDVSTNMHLGFSSSTNDSSGHLEFQLIRSNYDTDFLPGLPEPEKGYIIPTGLYDRFLDSLSGVDESGAVVPDPSLPKLLQLGINVRPRQGFFANRLEALRNYLEYANQVVAQHPINEFGNITFLYEQGDYFNTSNYWENIYWWATGYSNNTRSALEVASYTDLLTLDVADGTIVGVASNAQGNREVYIYTANTWNRIGLQNGTIKFLSTLWNYTSNMIGFGDSFFDNTSYDSYPSTETRYIIRALNEQIYIGSLLTHRNKSLILIFEYIQSENIESQNYLPWLNKTSFADVSYNVRTLTTNQKFQRDNQSLLEGYINEVKPYHVVMKEFYLKYDKLDLYDGDITDYDLPSIYNTGVSNFVSPQLVYRQYSNSAYQYTTTSDIWDNSNYTQWFNNYGLTIDIIPDVIITTLAVYISTISTEIYVVNIAGFPVSGVIKLDSELISYSSVNRDTKSLLGIGRGVNNTETTEHLAGTNVVIDIPAVSVLNSGRDYVDTPSVTAYVDTTKYPAPRKAATLVSVMAGDKVIGVTVTDPGEGYVVTPEIVFEDSYVVTSTFERINFVENTIQFLDISFSTGDLVYMKGIGTNGNTLVPDGFYYVAVIQIAAAALFSINNGIIVSLHHSYQDAILGQNHIIFADELTISADYVQNMSIRARAIPSMVNNKVRSLKPILRFDRTSYNSRINEWVSGNYYSSPYVSNDINSSAPEKLYLSTPTTVESTNYTVTPSGGTGAIFNVYNILMGGTYDVEIEFQGSGYSAGAVITILGEDLNGNNAEIKLSGTTITGSFDIAMANTTGIIANQYIVGIGIPYAAKVVSVVTNTSITIDYPATASSTNTLMFGSLLPNDCIIKCIVNAGAIVDIDYVIGSGNDIYLASIQGAVLPIVSTTSVDGNAVVTVDYSYSNLLPGQVNGSYMYFYRVQDTYRYDDSSSSGAIIDVWHPKFNPFNINNLYYIQVIDRGSIYTTGDKINIPGSALGGIDGTNDCSITIQANLDGSIFIATVSGFSNGQFGQYYVKAISDTELEVYSDPKFINPISYSSFIWNNSSTDYGYLPEPIIANYSYGYNLSSIVYYAGSVWQCITANNDTEFDPTKWVALLSENSSLNALDRIEAYYEPTIDMPGKDAQQLVKGITYPHTVYYGNAFAPEDVLPIDFVVRDEPFYPRGFNAKATIFDGTNLYVAGSTDEQTLILKFDIEGTFVSSSTIADQSLEVTDITYANDGFEIYMLTTSNEINPLFVSYDGANWIGIGEFTPYDATQYGDGGYDSTSILAPYVPLYAALIANGAYFAAGKDVLRSIDSFSYQNVFDFGSRLPTYLNDIAYINIPSFEGYIAVGIGYNVMSGADTAYPTYSDAGRVLISTDGTTWVQLLPTFAYAGLNGLANSSTQIVAVGDNGNVWYSSNGSNWSQGNFSGSTPTANINSVTYGNGLFVAVGDQLGLYSTDGITWTAITTSSIINAHTLNQVYFGNDRFYVAGEDNIIISSSDGINWFAIGDLIANDPFYVVQGNDFLYGYGPEELVAGVVTDTLSMYVTTAPGAYWDLDITYPYWYKHTGFNMKSFIAVPDNNYQISFSDVVLNPARISVFLLNNSTNLSTRIYEDNYGSTLTYNYSVDWYNQTITFNNSANPSSIPNGYSLMVELYEVGNGKELVRGNSRNTPLQVDINTGKSMYLFNTQYENIINDPLVYVSVANGSLNKLVYDTDYFITNTSDNLLKLVFTEVYNASTDYIVYSILGDCSTATSVDQYGYSIPETQVFVAASSTTDFELDMSLINVDGDNIVNSIVEKNGKRLAYLPSDPINTDYSFIEVSGTWYLRLEVAASISDIIAVTTFYDTSRQFLTTGRYISGTSLRVTAVSDIDNTVSPVRVTFANDPNTSVTNISGSLFKLDGVNGTTEVNGNTYYINQINSTTYDLYSLVVTTSVIGASSDLFITTTNITDIVIGMLVTGSGIGKGASNGGAFITNIQADTPTAGTYKITLSVANTDVVSSANFSWKTIGDDFSQYVSGGFGWDNLYTIQVPYPTVPGSKLPMTYTDGSRTWVTVNGNRLDPNYVKFYNDNYIGILHTLTLSEEVVITSMVTGASPNSIGFNVTVNKNGQGSVTRTNQQDGSWLTQEFVTGDDSMYFHNVSNLIEQSITTVNVVEVDSVIYAYVQCDINQVRQVEVYNNTTLEILTDTTTYGLSLINGRPAVVFTSGAVAGNIVTVTLIIGNIVEINGERIKFNFIDINNNVITGLTRGLQGTYSPATHAIYSIGYGITPARRLTDVQYIETWNSSDITDFGDPLQISTTVAANFLNSIN
jgi:hypothetical protein